MIVDVAFDDGSISICKLLEDMGNEYLVDEFICKRNGTCMFSGKPQTVSKESVCGYYDVTEIEYTGLYRKVSENAYEPIYDSDEDYEVSSESESESLSDISLEDEE